MLIHALLCHGLSSSAPELVGLLSELNFAIGELEDRVNPLLSKVRYTCTETKHKYIQYIL